MKFRTIPIVMLIMFASCGQIQQKKEIRNTFYNMRTHSVKLNLDRMEYCVPDNDKQRADTLAADLKLIIYVDSSNCSPCIINRMYKWNYLIDKARECHNAVNFIFIFDPKEEQVEDAHLAVESSGLKNRIYLDTAHVFIHENEFIPKEEMFHTFLVDKNGRIIMIGNPQANKNVEKIFLNTIKKKI